MITLLSSLCPGGRRRNTLECPLTPIFECSWRTRILGFSMRRVLVDNGSVRAVLSLMIDGQGARSPSKIFDLNLACAEAMIETLVLSEHIVVPKIHKDYPDVVSEINNLLGCSDIIS